MANGEKATVAYALEIYQDEIFAGGLDDPHATLPGLKRVTGTVKGLPFSRGINLLEMVDGRKLKFFFHDTTGRITVNEWMG